MFRLRLSALVAIATAFLLVASAADARPLGGFSAGSRGMRTYSAPPSTATAPSAAPIQRSLTRPPAAAPFGGTAPRSGFFSGRGLFGGLAAGFFGAGLLGMLFGYGFFGGMAGFASILGLLLQIVLIVIVARLIFAWWRRRNSPAAAYAGGGHSMGYNFASLGGMSSGAAAQTSTAPVTITKSDYDAFERLLGDVQYAFSAEDLSALRGMLTPEMLSYFSEQLADNASRGLVNRVTDVKLLQGDLAEAWREGPTDYATVAIKYALKDSMVDRATGRIVQGAERSEVTELWTFRRTQGGKWVLSAIQQT